MHETQFAVRMGARLERGGFRSSLGMMIVLAAATVAGKADVVYVNSPDVRLFPGLRSYGIDLNGDGVDDVGFNWGMDCPSGCSADAHGRNGGELAVSEDPWFTLGLHDGDLVGPDLDWESDGSMMSCDAGGCFGLWSVPGEVLFLALRFPAEDGLHYAWIRGRPVQYGIWLLDYAYESTPDQPIVATAAMSCDAGGPCDTNCDGSVNQFDIQPFIESIQFHWRCSSCAGDANGGGSANQFDIAAFVECLVQ